MQVEFENCLSIEVFRTTDVTRATATAEVLLLM